MSEVAQLPAATDHPVASVDLTKSDDENPQNESVISTAAPDLDKTLQQSQDKSVNSHHHDSEYDTASDLEGGDDYTEDDESEDGSLSPDDDDDEESNEGSIEFDAERERGDGQEQIDYTKKVDEDRSNPQYIPKKGTFYEHDDRTADEPNAPSENQTDEAGESTGENSNNPGTPNISAASKTMKKWQPASDRWSHDRYDENEQAPKSRAELVSAYGYDIRNEDGPPRARRRRRYARGPTKYERKWEDGDAYIKVANNVVRKPPRPEDFPALGDRKGRNTKSFREGKENRFDRQNERNSTGSYRFKDREGSHRNSGSGRSFRSGGRQPPMEFKNKNRGDSHRNSHNRSYNDRDQFGRKDDLNKSQVETVSFTNTKATNTAGNQTQTYTDQETNTFQTTPEQDGYNRDLRDKIDVIYSNLMNNNAAAQLRPQQSTMQNSHLSSRLQQVQQVQNRNDPSHVGSVQMHSLAMQSQQQQQKQMMQQSSSNSLQGLVEMQQAVVAQSDQGRPKRYSSLRQRSQNDPNGLHQTAAHQQQIDQQLQQQIQLQHEAQQAAAVAAHQQQQQQPQQLLIQQANLLQLYQQQENIQAQMQVMQVTSPQTATAPTHPAKTQYPAVAAPYPAPSQQSTTAYYAPANEYVAPTQTAPPQPQYSQPQAPPAYLQTQQIPTQHATAPIGYTQSTNPTLSQSVAAATPAAAPAPNTLNYVQTTPQNPAAPAGGYTNYSGFQNFNTVGGTTYFVPPQQPPRPVVLPQRPTKAIPILPPSDKVKREKEEDKNSNLNAPLGSAENIDHILDNMFVQRPPYQPPTRKSASPPNTAELPNAGSENAGSTSDNRIEEAVKNLSISDENPKQNPTTQSVDANNPPALTASVSPAVNVGGGGESSTNEAG